MAYIGQNADGNFTTSVSKDTFSGNGSTTAFTLSEGATTNTVDVFVENIRQEPTTAYTVDGTTLTFTAAPVSGTDNIYVVNRGPIQLSASHPAAQALTAYSATITTDLTVDTNTLYVDSTNSRVGVGTVSPSSFFSDANQLVVGSGSGSQGITISSGTSENAQIFFADGTSGNAAYRGIVRYLHSSDAMAFYTSGANERMRVDSSGDLFVSKTSQNVDTDGHELRASGVTVHTAPDASVLFLNRRNSDGAIATFMRSGSTVASIDVLSSDNITFSATTGGGAGLLFFGASGTDPTILPMKENAVNDGETDLGRGANRFKDLFLSGSVYLGGTGSANALDDYEEGTFTPTYLGSSSNPTVTYDGQTSGSYVKIGRQVIAKIVLRTDSVSGGSGNLYIGGLPFAASAASGTRAGTLNVGYSSNFLTKSPQSGYINDNDTVVVLTTNLSTDAISDLSTAIQVSNMQTGTNDNFIMATLIYET